MFNNLLCYRFASDWSPVRQEVEEALARHAFAPTSPAQEASAGWAPPREIDNAPMIEAVGNHWLFALREEKRLLPAYVVNTKVQDLAAKIEQLTGRKPGRKVLKDLKEQARHELLPSAFTKQSLTKVWIDWDNRILAIASSNITRADEVVALLMKTLEGLTTSNLQTNETPQACMAAWLLDGVPPSKFTCDSDVELRSADERRSVVRYTRHNLDIDQVREHLKQGLTPTMLAMTYADRVSFVLTDALMVKKIKFLDLAFEGRTSTGAEEAFDADAALACSQLSAMISDLLYGLGGMLTLGQAAAEQGDAEGSA